MPTPSNASRPSLITPPVTEILSPTLVRIGTEIFEAPFLVQLELSSGVPGAPVSARVLDSTAREVWRVLPTLADLVEKTEAAAVTATAWGFVLHVHERVASEGQTAAEARRAAGIADQDTDDDDLASWWSPGTFYNRPSIVKDFVMVAAFVFLVFYLRAMLS